MQVFDEVNGCLREFEQCLRVVVKHIPGQIVFGYVDKSTPAERVLFFTNGSLVEYVAYREKLGDTLVYSNRRGMYLSRVDLTPEQLINETLSKGVGKFPYHFEKKYEACENFRRFQGKQEILNPDKFHPLSNYLKYSFGLEFETSQGYVPEDICYRDGLIPLRDGSIAGIEYSTVVLSGSEGISLLEQQVESMRKYTDFNKECSLHIHMGGYQLTSKKIFNLYYLCKHLEIDISLLVPRYTFNTSKYKANHKDYCNQLPVYRSFGQMYEHLVGRKFLGDFTQPHPNDIRREAKWRIPTRYTWVNFINALCYNINKTIEFRFLRPTYNFQKIILWLYILNAIMRYAEEHMENPSNCTSLVNIIRRIYPKEVAERVILGISKLRILTDNQTNNGDFIGQDIYMEEEMFSEDLGI